MVERDIDQQGIVKVEFGRKNKEFQLFAAVVDAGDTGMNDESYQKLLSEMDCDSKTLATVRNRTRLFTI